jgi:nickel-dependent lactate racemase
MIKAVADKHLDGDTIHETIFAGLEGQFTGQRILVLIPDHTRTLPLPELFKITVDALHDAHQVDFMVALGTHPPLNEEQLCKLVGITPPEKASTYRHIGLFNHDWQNPDALVEIGKLTRDQVQAIAGEYWHESLGGDAPIRINRLALEYDHIIILGPVFPHEVVGFSGGAKYLFPGISGAEMINVTHWLGALITILEMIGIKQTPVRDMIHAAAAMVPTPITLVALVVDGYDLAGIFIGDYREAWSAAADLSSERHIVWLDEPVQSVLSVAPPMYDELWTAAKAMYKMEPVIADGGEVIIYAPHLDEVSFVHGKYIYDIGYHVRDYFLKQWDTFRHVPAGVIAHSTHLKGSGTFDNGTEKPRINVTMATAISEDDCKTLNLGYLPHSDIHPEKWQNSKDCIYVPKAGEMLYRLRK